MDVQLPDGRLLKGVPDGTTKAQLSEKLSANGIKFDSPPASESPKEQKPNTPGDFSMFSSPPEPRKSGESNLDYLKRNTYAGNAITGAEESGVNVMEGSRWLGEKLYGKNPHDEAEKAAFDAANQSLEKKEGSGFGNFLARAAGDPLNYVAGGFAKEGKLAEKAVAGGKAAAQNTAQGIGTMKSGFNARNQEGLEGAIKGMESEAQRHFSTLKGIGISSEIATKVFDHIDKAVREEREIDPDLHADYVKAIERMKEKAKAGMTLQQMHLQRQLLRDVETKNFLNNKPVAGVARKAIDAMDEVLETAKQKGMSKEGSAGVQGMQSGIAKWAQARKFETVANVIQRSQGDPNKLKSGFTTLLNNKKLMRGFTAEEKAAIKAASENSSAEGLMKMIGKFGFDLSQARSGGNTLPWLAGFGAKLAGASTPELGGLATVGTGAKYGQKLMARGKAENVLKAIENRNNQLPFKPTMGASFNQFLTNQ